MAHLLIEENFQHLDGLDVEELIEALAALGLNAEPTQPRSTPSRHGWTLTLHWLKDDTSRLTEQFLTVDLVALVRDVLLREHAAGSGGTSVRDRSLPHSIALHDRTGRLLTTIPVPGAP